MAVHRSFRSSVNPPPAAAAANAISHPINNTIASNSASTISSCSALNIISNHSFNLIIKPIAATAGADGAGGDTSNNINLNAAASTNLHSFLTRPDPHDCSYEHAGRSKRPKLNYIQEYSTQSINYNTNSSANTTAVRENIMITNDAVIPNSPLPHQLIMPIDSRPPAAPSKRPRSSASRLRRSSSSIRFFVPAPSDLMDLAPSLVHSLFPHIQTS